MADERGKQPRLRPRRSLKLTREQYSDLGIAWTDDEWATVCSTREIPMRRADGAVGGLRAETVDRHRRIV